MAALFNVLASWAAAGAMALIGISPLMLGLECFMEGSWAPLLDQVALGTIDHAAMGPLLG